MNEMESHYETGIAGRNLQMSLQDQSENLEQIKLICTKHKEELKQKALSMVWRQDQEQGEGWSDDSYSIADIMVKFYLELVNE
jgi:hypothetical protein